MTNHLSRGLVYHCPLVIAGILAVEVRAADTTEHEQIFKTTLVDNISSIAA